MKISAASVLFLLVSVSGQAAAGALFEERFEQKDQSRILAYFSKISKNVEVVPGAGVGGSAGLRVTYQGNERGSERLAASFLLTEPVSEGSLSFDVKFEKDFQFVRGGKLHGLGPSAPVTGGHEMQPSGWSSRIMFQKDGAVSTYLYHQNKTSVFGDYKYAKGFRLEKGAFHSLTLCTRLNSLASKADGEARIYADGKLIVVHDSIKFWAGNLKESMISRFLFSTFHGGDDATWAPKDRRGRFARVHAVFDNFVVQRGCRIRTTPGGDEH